MATASGKGEKVRSDSGPWAVVPLGEVLTHNRVYVDEPEHREYPKLSVKLYGKGVVIDTPVDGSTLKMKRHQLAKPGQVILSEIWGKKGAIGIVPDEGDGALCTSHFFLFDVDHAKIERGWLQAIFTANYLESQLGEKAFGTTGYAAVRPNILLAATIPLPPLEFQRRLVAKIEYLAARINEARGLRERSHLAINAMGSAKTTEIFNDLKCVQALPLRSLGDKGENPIQTGPFGAQLKKHEFTERGVPVLNVGNVWPEGIRFDRLDHVTEHKAAQLSRYELATDDLLFARSGATLGKVCVVPERCNGWLMTGHLFRVRFDQGRCLPRFAFAALRGAESVRGQVFGQVRGATRPGFNTTLLGNVAIPLPSIEEQHRIVTYLDGLQARVDRLKALQQKTAATIDALLPSILDKAFRGSL